MYLSDLLFMGVLVSPFVVASVALSVAHRRWARAHPADASDILQRNKGHADAE